MKMVINEAMPSARANVLLLSCYELGHQPLGLASPLAFLERARIRTDAIDLAVEPLDEARVRRADFVAVSVPMHTALGIALAVLPRLRALAPDAHLCFYGLYATLNAELLLASGVDSVLSGECEEALVEQVARWRARTAKLERKASPVLKRLDFPVPSRKILSPLELYAELALPDGSPRKVGAVESSRGCLHLCRHCPIPPVYGGRFFTVPRETVLSDVRQLVEAGARHIDFVDADFLNGPGHALAIASAIHREHPDLTFNFTAKVEHVVRHGTRLEELRRFGCLFLVSAVESLSDRVLAELSKGHDREGAFAALALTRDAGIAFRPTFVAFTPWTRREDYLDILRWIGEEGLVESVDPIQLTLRLLVPPGSLLLGNESFRPHLGHLNATGLTYHWTHPDPGMDRLQKGVQSVVEEGLRSRRSSRELFHEIFDLASGGERVPGPLAESRERPARLTEAWFC
jgi:radical SAM superfamily enzyme YgiQ (UPF0313 family)